MEALIKAGAPVNMINPDTGRSALHVACMWGKDYITFQLIYKGELDAVSVLLKAGAQPNIKDYEGFRPVG